MPKKNLRSTTIIPKELYVERAADRQLRSIIDDMGRPGYVLVARQMGKTNLLINMKRERISDVVLYLDLSVIRFESVRTWFRHVIDSLIDAYPDLFKGAIELITEQRSKSDLEPNVEYERHLRLLLRSIKQRFIIVLDEIDSLVNASYSDTILAQIRSMYFSRVNNPEYERLTYVLSGVAEPADLIKDKNISPFNIGEKIYLEDFCKEEFIVFMEKANINVNSEISNSIYNWTRGNPRMTWDVCSELEDRILNGESVTEELVDLIVEKLYLRDYDRAPIDHIRTLAEFDHQIRDAITSIRYGKAKFIDHKIKSRLYLSGITCSTAGGEVAIKNKIIDEALSDHWLSLVDSAKQTLLMSASQYFIAKQYDLAIRQYELVFSDSSLVETASVGDRLEFGLSYFYAGNMPKAIEKFQQCIVESKDPSTTQSVYFYLALAEFNDEHYDECLPLFKEASNGPLENLRISAKLNTILTMLNLGSSYYQQAVDYGRELVEELDIHDNLDHEEKLELLVTALCYSAKANISLGDFEVAKLQLERAFSLARPKFQHSILLFKYELPQNEEVQSILVAQAAQTIIDNNLHISDHTDNLLELNKKRLAINLTLLSKHGLESEFDDLIRYITNQIFDNKMTVAEVLLNLYESIDSEEKRLDYIPLLERAINSYFNEVNIPSIQLKLLRFVSLYSNAPQRDEWLTRYMDELRAQAGSDFIEDDDFVALSHLVNSSFLRKTFPPVEQLIELWKDLEAQATEQSRQWSILFAFYEMEFFMREGKKGAATQIAIQLVSLTDKIEVGGLPEESFNSIILEIRRRALALQPNEPIKRDQFSKIGRNQKISVRYGNSDIQEKKFKQVERDLREGRCVIIKE
jgi:tetratricopeptide (TPR) repeat protein